MNREALVLQGVLSGPEEYLVPTGESATRARSSVFEVYVGGEHRRSGLTRVRATNRFSVSIHDVLARALDPQLLTLGALQAGERSDVPHAMRPMTPLCFLAWLLAEVFGDWTIEEFELVLRQKCDREAHTIATPSKVLAVFHLGALSSRPRNIEVTQAAYLARKQADHPLKWVKERLGEPGAKRTPSVTIAPMVECLMGRTLPKRPPDDRAAASEAMWACEDRLILRAQSGIVPLVEVGALTTLLSPELRPSLVVAYMFFLSVLPSAPSSAPDLVREAWRRCERV